MNDIPNIDILDETTGLDNRVYWCSYTKFYNRFFVKIKYLGDDEERVMMVGVEDIDGFLETIFVEREFFRLSFRETNRIEPDKVEELREMYRD